MAGAFTFLNGEVFKVWACAVPSETASNKAYVASGTVVSADSSGITVQTGDGLLVLKEIQPAGKRNMPAAEWLKGARLEPGTRLGDVGAV